MSPRPLVFVVTALLIVVSVLVVVPGAFSAPSSRASVAPAAVPAAGPIVITPTDSNGFATDLFAPGPSTGRVYFSITDPSLDANVTVHVYDTNATRDGLTNPVATWTVNVSSGTYASTHTGLEYTLPTALLYGGTWNLTASGKVGGFDSVEFSVQTYTIDLVSSPSSVLAGHSGSVFFSVSSLSTGAPYTAVTSVNLTAEYYDGTTAAYARLNLSATSFSAGVTSGSASFLLPVNASHHGDIFFDAWANVTSSGKYSVFSDAYSYIGNFFDATFSVQCNCIGNAIAANSLVELTVTTQMTTYAHFNAPGVPVSFAFWSGPNRVANSSIPGNPPASLTTNLDGQSSILFVASPSAFSTSATDQINISVLAVPSVSGSIPQYDNLTYDFLVIGNASAGATIVTSFGAALYFGGDPGTATWQVLPAHAGTTNGWSASSYQLSVSSAGVYTIVAMGFLSGLSGTINFTAPMNYTGGLDLSITAHNESSVIAAVSGVEVLPADLVVIPSEAVYQPGDTVRFTVETYGSLFAKATIFETVRSSSGATLSSGVVVNDTFSITLPSGVVPPYVEAIVTAETASLGVFASSEFDIYESEGAILNVGISTVSQYSDGSFQPGQTVTVTWSESNYGPGQPAMSYWVYLWNANGWFSEQAPLAVVLTSATSGTFSYTIPSGSTAGAESLWVSLSPAVPCVNYCYASGQVTFQVNPSPSALNYELGAGSGITVGWLILLLAIVVVAVLLVLLIRRGRAPKSPPAAEWKEPEAAATSGTAAPPPPPPADGSPPPPPPPSGDPGSPPPLPGPGSQ